MNTVKRRILSLVIWVVVGLGAAYGVVLQRDTSEKRQEEEKDARRVLSFRVPGDVAKVEVDNHNGKVTLERSGDVWRVSAPLDVETDDNAVPSMLYAVLGLEHLHEVGDRVEGEIIAPTNLSLFELAPPRGTMTLTGSDGRTETLLVGKRNSFDGSLYVKRGNSPKVYLVSGKGEHQLLQGLLAYRAKTLVNFDRKDIRALSVTMDAMSWRAERTDDGFQVVEPMKFRASRERVDGLLRTLEEMRLSEFYDYPGAPAAPAPVTKPKVSVVLTPNDGPVLTFRLRGHDDGSQKHTIVELQVGEQTMLPARLFGTELLGSFSGSPTLYRDMEALIFDRDAVEGMTLSIGDQVIELGRQQHEDEARPRWVLREPVSGPAHSPRLEGILYALRRMVAKDVLLETPTDEELEAHGLAEGAPQLKLAGAGGQELARLIFGKVEGEHQEVLARGRVLKVAKSDLGAISFDVADYRKK